MTIDQDELPDEFIWTPDREERTSARRMRAGQKTIKRIHRDRQDPRAIWKQQLSAYQGGKKSRRGK